MQVLKIQYVISDEYEIIKFITAAWFCRPAFLFTDIDEAVRGNMCTSTNSVSSQNESLVDQICRPANNTRRKLLL